MLARSKLLPAESLDSVGAKLAREWVCRPTFSLAELTPSRASLAPTNITLAF
jgi:hypothetical protein